MKTLFQNSLRVKGNQQRLFSTKKGLGVCGSQARQMATLAQYRPPFGRQSGPLRNWRRFYGAECTSHGTCTAPAPTPNGKGPKGFLTLDQLKHYAQTGEIDNVVVGFTDHCGRLYGKRLDVDFFLKNGHSHGTHACQYLLTIDIEQNIHEGYDFASWNTGFGDFHMAPDLNTLRVAAWLDRTAFVLCDLYNNKTHELINIAPRSILKRQIERAKEMGLSPLGATELEYYSYKVSYENANKMNYAENTMEPFGYLMGDYNLLQSQREEVLNSVVRRHLKNSGITVESSKGEAGLGQHELNIEYSDLLSMGDHHVLYKQCFKETAQQLGISVTFMAKPHASQSGSSCHVHISLWDEKGKNAFRGEEALGDLKCSKTFQYFLGGCIKYTPDITVFMGPTVNSYKRFRPGSWAPTRIGWSLDNRTAGYRIIGEDSNGFRIECRIPGADCNPYLVMAAILGAGLEGIEKQILPPHPLVGDVYNMKNIPHVASTLRDATRTFEHSEMAKKVFGTPVVRHYANYFHKEVDAYDKAVTDWERKRYFEQI